MLLLIVFVVSHIRSTVPSVATTHQEWRFCMNALENQSILALCCKVYFLMLEYGMAESKISIKATERSRSDIGTSITYQQITDIINSMYH